MRGAIMPYLLLTRFEIELNICSQIRYSKELQILGLSFVYNYIAHIPRYIKKRVMP